MQLLSYEEFLIENDWIQGREDIGQRAYMNYCDTAARYKERISTLQDLIQELQNAHKNRVHVTYVMGVDDSNFEYVGNDINLGSMQFVEATECLHIYTTSGNTLVVPDTYDIVKKEGIEAFTNTVEYTVREESFSISFLIHYE